MDNVSAYWYRFIGTFYCLLVFALQILSDIIDYHLIKSNYFNKRSKGARVKNMSKKVTDLLLLEKILVLQDVISVKRIFLEEEIL